MMRALGLDAGGTATRWVLADEAGGIVARGEAPPISGLLFTEAAIASARAAIARLAGILDRHGRPGAVLAGVTGSGGPAQDALLVDMLAAGLGLPPARVRIVDDLWLAHRARFAPGEGILVYCGTGSAAVHVGADGNMLRVGGHGYLIGDEGSGYAIARDALHAVLAAEDEQPGAGWLTPLGQEMARRIGGAGWDAVREYVYGGTRAGMAALAPAVAEAARAGDFGAENVLRRAGRDLALFAAVLLRRVGPQPLALAGGGARLHPLIHEAMQSVLAAPVETGEIAAAAAAARIAGGHPGIAPPTGESRP
jgi:glucosamine kinase